jgi:dephospho-CoA kinase
MPDRGWSRMELSGQNFKKRPACCKKIGVTGGTGTGKSVFSREFGRMGACVIDADAVARELTVRDEGVRRKLMRAFGSEMFTSRGRLKRAVLADRVFKDQRELEKLNRIMWPPLKKAIRSRMAGCLAGDPDRTVVVDAAILFDAGMASWFDLVFVIEAPLSSRISRLVQSRGWTGKQAKERIVSQPGWSAGHRTAFPGIDCSSVIRVRNSGSKAEWKATARALYKGCRSHV